MEGRAWKLFAMADMPSAALRPHKISRDWKGTGNGSEWQGASYEGSGFNIVIPNRTSGSCWPEIISVPAGAVWFDKANDRCIFGQTAKELLGERMPWSIEAPTVRGFS